MHWCIYRVLSQGSSTKHQSKEFIKATTEVEVMCHPSSGHGWKPGGHITYRN